MISKNQICESGCVYKHLVPFLRSLYIVWKSCFLLTSLEHHHHGSTFTSTFDLCGYKSIYCTWLKAKLHFCIVVAGLPRWGAAPHKRSGPWREESGAKLRPEDSSGHHRTPPLGQRRTSENGSRVSVVHIKQKQADLKAYSGGIQEIRFFRTKELGWTCVLRLHLFSSHSRTLPSMDLAGLLELVLRQVLVPLLCGEPAC